MDLAIIPECYLDTNIIETLVPPNKGYNHQHGCGTVLNIMKNKLHDKFAVGIIDKDKDIGKHSYLKEFNSIIKEGNLELLKHKQRPHYIIIINPAIEKFIYDNAVKLSIDLSNYQLPTDFEEFIKRGKREVSQKSPEFKSLIKAIRKAGSEDFVRLESWLIHLKNNPYQANIDDIKNL